MAATIVYWIFQILYILLLARVIISWIRVDPNNPIVQFIFQATEPLLAPIRRLLPATGGIDFSPLILFLVLGFLQRIVLSIM